MLPDKVRAALIPCDRLVGIQEVSTLEALASLFLGPATRSLHPTTPLLRAESFGRKVGKVQFPVVGPLA